MVLLTTGPSPILLRYILQMFGYNLLHYGSFPEFQHKADRFMFMPSFFCLLVAEFAILQVSQTTGNGQLGFKSGECHMT